MGTESAPPNVRVPPPPIFGVALGLGLLCQRLLPIPLGTVAVGRVLKPVGTFLAVCSGVLAVSAFHAFRRYRTTFRTDRSATELLVSGPFRLTRNPLYLSLVLLVVALSLITNTAWPLALLVPAIIIVQRTAIVPEERFLLAHFGQQYEEYRRRVRRWL